MVKEEIERAGPHLVHADPGHPLLAHGRRVDEDVDLLRMEPRLDVLVPVPLNSDAVVHDEKLCGCDQDPGSTRGER